MNRTALLVGLAAVLLAVVALAHRGGGDGHWVDVEELSGLLDSGAAAVVDVRTPREFAAGHIPGAINVPYDEAAARVADVAAHADGRMLVLYCRSGRRARIAEPALAAAGVTEIHHLDGQMSGWARSGRPVATGL